MQSQLISQWRILSKSYDRSIGVDTTRSYLIKLGRARFADLSWQERLAERREEFPEFFDTFDYTWCNNPEFYDFPIETSLQTRTLDAAIALWRAKLPDMPSNPDLGWIVARSTFLANFAQATPHVQPSLPFKYVISPLGWLEFVYRYFTEFGRCVDQSAKTPADMREVSSKGWLSITANVIASSCDGLDYFLPEMVKAIKNTVACFADAEGDFDAKRQNELAGDLCYAAHDFALCHEVAHIAASDFTNPDESRADRWGLAAYLGSWGRRPLLHMHIGNSNGTRAIVGPIGFGSAGRSLLATKALIERRLRLNSPGRNRGLAVFTAFAERSRWLLARAISLRDHHIQKENPVVAKDAGDRLLSLIEQLASYEMGFAEFNASLKTEDCEEARRAAVAAEKIAARDPASAEQIEI
ncbi:MAG TPA: hypothetical protein VG326_10905 [Tepidisphaeraceae bacterium]|nr:hypothetical protein [Tepidisphaeraceae bacterium]